MDDAPGNRESDGPLLGGNMNTVIREGDTVLRNAGRWTPTVHRYLAHLRQAGIDWIPAPMAIHPAADGGARERLSYVHGEVPVYPLPKWVWATDVLHEGARRLRQLHDASIGFGLDGARWQAPAKIPAEVVCHNDFAPHNLAFRDGGIAGVIDFDFCSPGPRLWDIAYFATRAVPLSASPPPNAPGMSRARQRVDTILSAYGSDHGGPAMTWDSVLRVAIIRLHDLADMSRHKAVELSNPELAADAETYDLDGRYLATLRL